MTKPIVFQIVPRLYGGGAERVSVDFAAFLSSLDDVPTYVISSGGGLVKELERSGCTHITMDVATKNPFKILKNGLRLARLAKMKQVDLFHVHSRMPAWSVYLAAHLSKIPYISTYHGAYRNEWILKNFYNSAMIRGRCVIAISDFILGIIKRDHGIKSPEIVKIYQGIDTQLFDPRRFSPMDLQHQRQEWGVPLECPLILAIGRISPGKRYDLAMTALAQLKRKDVFLVIVGSDQGSEVFAKDLRAMADKQGIRDQVRFIGDCSNIPLAYATSDVVVFPTEQQEAFGRISAEAGAMEKIVIASNVGAIPEIVRDNQTGFLFPPKNHDILCQKLESVLNMTLEERNAIGKRAREHIQNTFPAQRMYHQTLELYKKLCDSFSSAET
jgi:glycosyltransferase involved in cell wall biosynthesis